MSQTKAQLLAPVGIFTASGINVSGTLTATSYSGSGTNLSGVGVGTTASVNTSGIITAVSFSGDGSNLGGVGFGTEDSAITTGIITASKFSGSGIGLTNIGGAIAGLVYSPSIGATSVLIGTNIEIIFSKPIQAGVGTITLRTDAADGAIVESYDITSSDRLTINTAKLTIDTTDNLSGLTTYFVVIPSGTVKDTFAGISSNVGISSYSFTTQQLNYELWTWGLNTSGQSGTNDRIQYSSPVQLPGTQWRQFNATYASSRATKTDGTLWAWGYNAAGQLGQNNTTDYSSPTQVPGTQWDKIATGEGNGVTLATKTDGTLWSWGYNYQGRLGHNDIVWKSSPIQVPGTQWTNPHANGYSSFCFKTDGTLWAWGTNGNGQLGQNDKINRSSPIQIPGTQWTSISGSLIDLTLATKSDGTLWSWGYNGQGQLGLNDTIRRSSPTQIPGTQWSTNPKSLSGGGTSNSFAIKTDGTLWAWGSNAYGVLGQNDQILRSSPVQIPGTQWSKVEAGYAQHVAGLKTDGTLWTWGRNTWGQLGDNTITTRLSPVQVPGTQWYDIDSGSYHKMAIKQVAP